MNVHSLPVIVDYHEDIFSMPKVLTGEQALLEKIRIGLPSIIYRKLGELFSDNLRSFRISCRKREDDGDIYVNRKWFLYARVSLDAEVSLKIFYIFNDWLMDYFYSNNINPADYPTIDIEFVGSC